jgi:hypothetical protein
VQLNGYDFGEFMVKHANDLLSRSRIKNRK